MSDMVLGIDFLSMGEFLAMKRKRFSFDVCLGFELFTRQVIGVQYQAQTVTVFRPELLIIWWDQYIDGCKEDG